MKRLGLPRTRTGSPILVVARITARALIADSAAPLFVCAVNDSLRTTICLQYAPRCVSAAAAMMASNYLEAKLLKPCPLPPHPPGTQGKWNNAFQANEKTVQEIVTLIQNMYDETGTKSGGGPQQLANSGAVAKMRMHGANGAAPNGSSSSSGGGGGGGASKSAGAAVKPPEGGAPPDRGVKRESSGDASLKRETSGGARGGSGGGVAPKAKAEAEEGEIEEGELAPPAPKRAKPDGAPE